MGYYVLMLIDGRRRMREPAAAEGRKFSTPEKAISWWSKHCRRSEFYCPDAEVAWGTFKNDNIVYVQTHQA